MTEPLTEPDDETRVRALMREISRALQERDVPTLSGIFADDFTFADPSGAVLSKEQWLDDLASGDLTVESVSTDPVDVRAAGDAIRVRGQLSIRAKYSKSNYNGTFHYMGIYTKRDGDWKLALTSARRIAD
jgi:ketosteroid isomerase-like protein